MRWNLCHRDEISTARDDEEKEALLQIWYFSAHSRDHLISVTKINLLQDTQQELIFSKKVYIKEIKPK
jgi:hypothetical protein